MGKAIGILVVVGTVAGLGYFFTHYEVRRVDGHIVISPLGKGNGVDPDDGLRGVLAPKEQVIRIATFNVGPLDRIKLRSPLVASHLAKLIGDFDLVALQGLKAPNEGLIRELTDHVNTSGRRFDFAVSPDVSTQPVEQYLAFLFDKNRIEIDRSTVCSVEDPSGRFHQKPLAALFRARGIAPNEAFTFVLINVDIDPSRADTELDLLDAAVAAVKKSHPGEDDVILLGHFAVKPEQLQPLARIPNLTQAATNTVSTTRGQGLLDNLFFDRLATTEFTGRANAVDLIRRLNLDTDRALRIAEHMPVWAEFSIYEGGQSGQIPTRP
ncbi:MAG: hypothetical protein JW818_22650 [Pirellulales bacterium]|nr:hypothetical protein [Pirellulales bacterium]